MTTLTWPTLTRTAPREFEFRLHSNTITFMSPLSRSVQTIEMPGARWAVNFTLENLDEADAATLQAFVVSLRGAAGRFYLHNFARPSPRGTIAGTPLVNGASQTGNTLNIDGCTVGTTLLPGDMFGVNNELKMVTATATANGSGQMAVTFEPPLRSSPSDNAPITTNRPTAIFMLPEDSVQWVTRIAKRTDVPISAIEAFS